MKLQSLRIRFIFAYAGLIAVGFAGLAMIAGQQLSNAARDDYELQLANEVILVAQGLARPILESQQPDGTSDDLELLLADYEAQTGATIRLFLITLSNDQTSDRFDHGSRDSPSGDGQGWPVSEELQNYPEIMSASLNVITIEQRDNEDSTETIFTAAPIADGPHFIGYVQLSEPASRLQGAINRRWNTLGLGVAGLTVIALAASFWLSTSLIRPLGRLRDSALRLSQGDLAHRITNHNTDEIGEVAQAFNQMAERVTAMIEEQRAFASNTSHELRTPLTTMRLRTEALRHDHSLDDAEREQYIVEIDDELIRLSGLIEDLILLSRFDARRAELGDARIDLQRFAHAMHHSLVSQAEEKNISFVLNVELDQPIQITASLNHLTILFRNLLDNAFKYTPAGGSVTWRISSDASEALFTIQDDGQGISDDDLPHLFERFYRADKARSRAVTGIGLGLPLAQSIVQSYGGQIAMTSEGIDRGTTVTVRWPVQPRNA